MLKKILWFSLVLAALAYFGVTVLSRGGQSVKVINVSGVALEGLRLYANEALIAQADSLEPGKDLRLFSQPAAAGALRLEYKHGWTDEKQVFEGKADGAGWCSYDLAIGPDQLVKVLAKSAYSF